MNSPSSPLDTERLSGLVFELASQLHAERLHRIALERALAQAGVIDPAALQQMASEPTMRELGRRAVEESVARMMRVLTECDDARTPLRAGG
ncbi:MAG TPA: hypothetical protein VLB75_08785 [Steroidobacteraceae bacterium]|nr:hypothetical protein [Steroidobacteraceae bacterium]